MYMFADDRVDQKRLYFPFGVQMTSDFPQNRKKNIYGPATSWFFKIKCYIF